MEYWKCLLQVSAGSWTDLKRPVGHVFPLPGNAFLLIVVPTTPHRQCNHKWARGCKALLHYNSEQQGWLPYQWPPIGKSLSRTDIMPETDSFTSINPLQEPFLSQHGTLTCRAVRIGRLEPSCAHLNLVIAVRTYPASHHRFSPSYGLWCYALAQGVSDLMRKKAAQLPMATWM